MKGLKSLLVTVLIGASTPLFAGKHPVPLDKNTDSAKCIECHEDKAKGKAVHSAIATGCTSCHEVRVSKDVTRIKLTTATPQALCFTCHADKNSSEIKGKVHPPAVRDCLKCHDPHTSPNQFQLLKATSGDKPDNLCLQCHDTGVNVPEKGSRHAALDSGCDTCHTVHKTGELGKQEFDYHLKKSVPALCADCHDVKDAALVKAHQGQPFANVNCTTCHDPHQSASPKLMQKFVHAAFAGNSCDTCHAEAKDGKVVLTQADSRALCLTCHEEQAKKIESAKVQHPGAQGECIACHNPHAGKTPGFIQPDPVNACLACHADQAEQHKKAYLHQPAFAQGCATCHEPHGGDNQHMLRATNATALCMECHGPEARPTPVPNVQLVTIFNGQVRLPTNYFAKVPRLPVKYGLGHPVERHPVADQMDPTDNTKVRVAVNCASCHQPHASTQPNLLVNDQANGVAFCANCHKDLGK
ncbi:MAG TPA: cytochrome c3 family protein [Terriglobales bacterium]|nr:cytochrome c3 family protein [Terriglobales bacterium]